MNNKFKICKLNLLEFIYQKKVINHLLYSKRMKYPIQFGYFNISTLLKPLFTRKKKKIVTKRIFNIEIICSNNYELEFETIETAIPLKVQFAHLLLPKRQHS